MMLEKGTWQNCLEYAALSDIGLRRENNQDHLAVSLSRDVDIWQKQGHLWLVADGMGAHAAGELASKLAADLIPTLFFKYVGLGAVEALRRAFLEANAEVFRRGRANPEFYNMGTTATVLVLLPEGVYYGHVGDSRAYRLRDKQFAQWTRDHSVVWELRERPEYRGNAHDLAGIPKNWITRSIGPSEELEPDISGPFEVLPGDTYLLCTDGLTGRVSDEEIAAVVGNYPPQAAVKILCDLANLRGGQDNTTVAVVHLREPLPEVAAEPRPAPPPVPARRLDRTSPLPIGWILSAVCLLGSLIVLIMNLLIPAVVLLLGAAALAIAQWARKKSPAVRRATSDSPIGPFVEVPAPDVTEAAQKLLAIAREARLEARQTGWEEDVPSLDEMEREVESAVKGRRYREALDAAAALVHELAERQRVFFKRYY
ncbi:MAG: hypothetical protein KatS3mg110_1082 [Pirellulaceae bacterium]|nr:MAG: hypothetical protein KatS3mg110_1082 [Pirellulaceae bacterium]